MFDSVLFFSGCYNPSRTFLPPLFRILNDFLSTHVPRAWRFNGCSRAHLNLSVDIGNYFADPQWLIVASWTCVLPAKCSRGFVTLISVSLGTYPSLPFLWSTSTYSFDHLFARKSYWCLITQNLETKKVIKVIIPYYQALTFYCTNIHLKEKIGIQQIRW